MVLFNIILLVSKIWHLKLSIWPLWQIFFLYQTLFLSKIEKYGASCRINKWLLRSYHHFQKHTRYTLGEEVWLESSVPLLKNKQSDGAHFVSVGQRPSKGHVTKYLQQLGGGSTCGFIQTNVHSPIKRGRKAPWPIVKRQKFLWPMSKLHGLLFSVLIAFSYLDVLFCMYSSIMSLKCFAINILNHYLHLFTLTNCLGHWYNSGARGPTGA